MKRIALLVCVTTIIAIGIIWHLRETNHTSHSETSPGGAAAKHQRITIADLPELAVSELVVSEPLEFEQALFMHSVGYLSAGHRTIGDVSNVFSNHAKSAKELVPESMVLVADAIHTCWDTGAGEGKEGVWNLFNAGTIGQDDLERLTKLSEDCEPIMALVPKGKHPTEFTSQLYIAAARAGSKKALLEELVFDYRSIGNVKSYAKAIPEIEHLMKSKDEQDGRAYFAALTMIGLLDHEISPLDFAKWEYLHCLNSQNCKTAAIQKNIRYKFTPIEEQEIYFFAATFSPDQFVSKMNELLRNRR